MSELPNAPSTASSPPPSRPAAPRGSSFLGCAFGISFLLNLLCGGVVIFSCLGFFFGFGFPTDGAGNLNERNHSGNSSSKDKIAIIALEGVIMEGMLGYVNKQIDQAGKDKNVKAVVLRINSPGGSITASDDLHRRLTDLRKGSEARKYSGAKPLVVSMASLAASGGYYVAMPADYLFAERTTMTGSIGVYVAFPNVAELAREHKLGPLMITIKQGEIKDSGSPFKEMSPKERAVWQDMVNQAYNQFVEVVEKGREKRHPAFHRDQNVPATQSLLVKRVPWEPEKAGPADLPQPELKGADRYRADGGIWTASAALKLDLIDQIGSLEDAIAKARELADLSDARAITYDRPRSLLESLMSAQATRPAEGFSPGRLKNGLVPRLWYLAPGCELAGFLTAMESE